MLTMFSCAFVCTGLQSVNAAKYFEKLFINYSTINHTLRYKQGTAEKQLLLMLSPCLNNIKKKKKKKKKSKCSQYKKLLVRVMHLLYTV